MHCPRCGYDASPAQETSDLLNDGGYVTIARFAWASEAGYFSHELGLSDFDTRIVWEDRSDAIHGFWQGEYLLQVSPESADAARSRLRGLLDDKGDAPEQPPRNWSREPAADADDPTYDPQTTSGINWVPIILTLTAGSVAAISFQVWSRHEEAPPVALDETPAVQLPPIGADREFVHEADDGTRWTVRFDPENDRVILTEDDDGDHRPDRRRVLHSVP